MAIFGPGTLPAVGPSRSNQPQQPDWNTLVRKMIDDLNPNSVLRAHSNYLAQQSVARGIDPRFIVALGYAETELGRTGRGRPSEGNNIWGIGAETFASIPDAIDRVTRLISGTSSERFYFAEGKYTVADIIAKYSPVGARNDPNNTNPGHPQNIATIMARYGVTGGVNADVRVGRDSTMTIPEAVPGGIGAVDDAIPGNPLSAIVDILKFVTDPALWLRIGAMVLGVIAMILGIIMFLRMGGSGAKPLGTLVAFAGFGFLYGGVKNIPPQQLVKDVIGA